MVVQEAGALLRGEELEQRKQDNLEQELESGQLRSTNVLGDGNRGSRFLTWLGGLNIPDIS